MICMLVSGKVAEWQSTQQLCHSATLSQFLMSGSDDG
jgi:hypothetical protein